ncbi:membrane associated rhomboid family serine protease [Methanolinea mesophila]|uniref:rhomboid family intramembrane serine protease n=1 Tax=Methanolinea mesophila TaxID=547055 RepID=UPI001AE26E3B|nr:rhomboid family intramembrane serine protease [Methanolinea mesophila]MBP1929161.1 membrane associated rhomboid family serine protease [Methanolinea mesophila]
MNNLLDYLKCNNSFKILTLLLVIIFILPLVWSIIFYNVPENVQTSLKLSVNNTQIWQYFTHSFVHNDLTHLQNNLETYFIAIIFGLIFALLSKNLKIFLILVLLSIFIFPPIWGILKVFFLNGLFPSSYECGSSGVIAALLGIVPVFFILSFSKYTGKSLLFQEYFYFFLIYIVFFFQDTYKTMDISPFLMGIYIASLLALFIVIFFYIYHIRQALDSKKLFILTLFSLMLFLLIYTIFIGFFFPQQLVSLGGRTAIETHYVGLVFGLFVSYSLVILSQNTSFSWLRC